MTSHDGLQSPKAFYNPSTSSGHDAVDTSSNTFQKFRSTLEQSLRTATRSKKLPPTPLIVDELAALAGTTKGKEKERPKNIEPHKGKMSILRKVTFGRGRESLSSPALQTSSQALPSPKSQSAIPGSSSASTADDVISPTRQRTRKVHRQSPEHSSPDAPGSPRDPLLSRHPSPKLPLSPSTSSLHRERPREAPTPTPPDTPTPKATPALRASSSIRSKSPTNRVVPSSVRTLSSASTSHLPLTSQTTPTPSSTPRRSIDISRRASDTRRTSTESPRHASPTDIRGESPSPSPICTRTRSPVQRSYSQSRQFNISSGSFVQPPSNPEHRELLRAAASLICREASKAPTETEVGQRDWGEVEVRTRALARLERAWSKSGSSVSTAALSSSSGLTASGEERERRLFCETLRDGYVLCQCVFSLH